MYLMRVDEPLLQVRTLRRLRRAELAVYFRVFVFSLSNLLLLLLTFGLISFLSFWVSFCARSGNVYGICIFLAIEWLDRNLGDGNHQISSLVSEKSQGFQGFNIIVQVSWVFGSVILCWELGFPTEVTVSNGSQSILSNHYRASERMDPNGGDSGFFQRILCDFIISLVVVELYGLYRLVISISFHNQKRLCWDLTITMVVVVESKDYGVNIRFVNGWLKEKLMEIMMKGFKHCDRRGLRTETLEKRKLNLAGHTQVTMDWPQRVEVFNGVLWNLMIILDLSLVRALDFTLRDGKKERQIKAIKSGLLWLSLNSTLQSIVEFIWSLRVKNYGLKFLSRFITFHYWTVKVKQIFGDLIFKFLNGLCMDRWNHLFKSGSLRDSWTFEMVTDDIIGDINYGKTSFIFF